MALTDQVLASFGPSDAARAELFHCRRCLRSLLSELLVAQVDCLRDTAPTVVDRFDHLLAGTCTCHARDRALLTRYASASRVVLDRTRLCARLVATDPSCGASQFAGLPALCITSLMDGHVGDTPRGSPEPFVAPPPPAASRISVQMTSEDTNVDKRVERTLPAAEPEIAPPLGSTFTFDQFNAPTSPEKSASVDSAFQARELPASKQSRAATESFADRVSVSNPTKVDNGALGSYTVFTCIVERRSGPNIVVQRRYSDFVKLRERLMLSHGHVSPEQLAGIPALPEKKLMGAPRALHACFLTGFQGGSTRRLWNGGGKASRKCSRTSSRIES